MEFKKLDISPKEGWIKRKIGSAHGKKTMIYMAVGAIAGLAFFYFTEGQNMANITFGEIIKSMLAGGFFGFFITNSPCARNKC
jgi:hypothetical protein